MFNVFVCSLNLAKNYIENVPIQYTLVGTATQLIWILTNPAF